MPPPPRPSSYPNPARLLVKVFCVDRPPTPWTWEIYREGEPETSRRTPRRFRSGADALEDGTAELNRILKRQMGR